GFSFSSCSDEAVCDKMVDMNNYKFVDLILGEEKETHFQKAIMDSLKGTQFKAFPAELQSAISSFCQSGGNLFISGAYVASDLFKGKAKDNPDVKFGKEVLKINLATDHASKSGNVFSTSNDFMHKMNIFNFNTKLSPDIYTVEAPDAIDPEKEASTILRYDENKFSAATAYKKDYGVIVFGFPFETILTDESRNAAMRSILNYFGMNPLQVAGH
ncbi:MAG: xanthan lyase, partial [Bacteroidota bacterium]|nr:xanthan lyase [Bacteroidota bacterium]